MSGLSRPHHFSSGSTPLCFTWLWPICSKWIDQLPLFDSLQVCVLIETLSASAYCLVRTDNISALRIQRAPRVWTALRTRPYTVLASNQLEQDIGDVHHSRAMDDGRRPPTFEILPFRGVCRVIEGRAGFGVPFNCPFVASTQRDRSTQPRRRPHRRSPSRRPGLCFSS